MSILFPGDKQLRNLVFVSIVGLQGIAWGQTASLSIGSASGVPGGTANLSISLSGGSAPAGLQWSFSFTSDVSLVSVTAGASTTAAGKTVTCAGNTCLAYGLNTNTIADGVVATATFQIAANPSTTNIGILLTSVVASTQAGTSIQAVGGSGTITLPTAVKPVSLSCSPATVNSPGTSICTVTLTAAAPAGGSTVALTSNNGSITVPGSVGVGVGLTSASFTATVAGITSSQTATLTASLNSASQTFSVTGRPLVTEVIPADIGVFRGGQWWLDGNSDFRWTGSPDRLFYFGQAGDIPIMGDWDSTGVRRAGVFRNGQWWLDLNNDGLWDAAHDLVFNFGQAGDFP